MLPKHPLEKSFQQYFPWPGKVVQSKVEQLIVVGVSIAEKEGSVCQTVGWGYPWLTAALPGFLYYC